jgi:hypothetical protein
VNANATWDLSEFDAAARAYIATTNRDLSEIVNQRCMNVNGRAFDAIPPANPVAKRKEINAYMWEPLSQKIKLTVTGKNKGKFRKVGEKRSQFSRVHLIVQARRKKEGKSGLYGASMRAVAGKFAQRAQISVGFVKSVFLPVILGLQSLVRFKFPFSKTKNIARWPGSAGYGRVRPAAVGQTPTATFTIGMALQRAGAEPKVQGMLNAALQTAFDGEAREMRAHTERKMQETARRFSSRTVGVS